MTAVLVLRVVFVFVSFQCRFTQSNKSLPIVCRSKCRAVFKLGVAPSTFSSFRTMVVFDARSGLLGARGRRGVRVGLHDALAPGVLGRRGVPARGRHGGPRGDPDLGGRAGGAERGRGHRPTHLRVPTGPGQHMPASLYRKKCCWVVHGATRSVYLCAPVF